MVSAAALFYCCAWLTAGLITHLGVTHTFRHEYCARPTLLWFSCVVGWPLIAPFMSVDLVNEYRRSADD